MRDRINELFQLFKANGFQLFLVGGAVRDMFLRNKELNEIEDFDFATNATPTQMVGILVPRKLFTIGEKFGTLGLWDNKFQITTYRQEIYEDHSRFPTVNFVEDLREDLVRRDFTINALAMSPNWEPVDFFGGQEDWKQGILRTPLRPDQTFKEDPLRMLRAFRFMSRY